MRRNEVLSQAIRMLTEHGFTPVIEQGRHIKVRWFDGERRQIVMSRSSSDHRAPLNSRAHLSRIIRNSSTVAERPDRSGHSRRGMHISAVSWPQTREGRGALRRKETAARNDPSGRSQSTCT
jgi:hypothetical protein